MGVPLLKNTAMAILLSDNMKTERVIIGEYLTIKNFFILNGESDFLVDIKRPIGQFIRDFIPRTIFMADMFVEVSRGIFDRSLKEFYESDNPVYKYIALRGLQEFHSPANDGYYDFAQDLRYSLFDDILKGQRICKENPFAATISLGVNFKPVEVMFDKRTFKEVAVMTGDLMPLAMWYMRKIYDKGYYLQKCKICDDTFLAKTATIEVLCSKKCKKTNARNLKKEFDERAKEVGYEQAYDNEYMYWYNRLKKFDKGGEEHRAFKDFRAKAIAMKKQVKAKTISDTEFLDWLFSQRIIADKLVGREAPRPSEKALRKKGKVLFDKLSEEYKGDEWYEDWREYAKMVLRKFAEGRFDDATFERFMSMDTFMEDPMEAERR